ncbi:MAG: signal peptidase II [Myxococcales bacterium]|nr:signal peptidase II [Myxococcales bacterium]
MGKYIYFVVLIALGVTADLTTKTWAENNLATHSSEYQNYLDVEVPAEVPAGMTLGAYLQDHYPSNTADEIEQIASSSLILDDAGQVARRGHPELELSGGEHVQVRQRSVTVIDEFLGVEDFLGYRYVQNRGAAWGILGKTSPSFRQPFFIVVGILAIGVIFLLYRGVPKGKFFLRTALCFIVAGAIGNIVDRVRYGYVVDFIAWRPGFNWPTFNIADVWIVIGVAMMFIEVIRDFFRDRKQKQSADSGDKAPAAS